MLIGSNGKKQRIINLQGIVKLSIEGKYLDARIAKFWIPKLPQISQAFKICFKNVTG